MLFVQALRDAMLKNQFPFSGHINLQPGKFHPFKSEGICKKECCRYKIFDHEIGAYFYCWRRQLEAVWFYKTNDSFTLQEKIDLERESMQRARIAELEKKAAIIKARNIWHNAHPVDLNHPYIIKKKIIPYNAKGFGEAIILPIINTDHEILSIQKIFPDGSKKIAYKTTFLSSFIVLGDVLTREILICEGWATGCTLHEVTKKTTIITINAANMVNVAKEMRKKFINTTNRFIYCADNDKDKIGQKYAILSAIENPGIVIIPTFKPGDEEYTDFNDLAALYGRDAVFQQINQYLID